MADVSDERSRTADDMRPLAPWLIAFLLGVAMIAASVWYARSGQMSALVLYLPVGGVIATFAAANLGRGAALTIKQLLVVVVLASVVGALASSIVYLPLVQAFGAERLTLAMALANALSAAIACLIAYAAGVLARRGARLRQRENIQDTFG